MPMQFYDQHSPSNVNHDLVLPYAGAPPVNSYLYVSSLYEAKFNRRWVDAGCLAAFIFGIQFCHLRAIRVKMFVNR